MEIADKNIFRGITKQELCDFLCVPNTKSVKVVELKSQIQAMLVDDAEYIKFLRMFVEQTAISPAVLEDILHCTKTERLRWTKEGKLKVVGYRSFKYGNYPIFSRYQVEKEITSETINSWREEHKLQLKGATEESKERAKATRSARDKAKKDILINLQEQKCMWQKKDKLLASTLELAYWTMWISRLAKSYQEKSRSCRHCNVAKYMNMVSDCYSMKNKSLFLLRKSPYVKLSFYRPDRPNKVHFHLCEMHYDDYCEVRSYMWDYGIWDYFWEHDLEVKECPNCTYEEEKDYYSLYYFELQDDSFSDVKFSFHLPYSIGKDELGNPNKLPSVVHEEQEGMFRFGRTLTDEEVHIFTYVFVTKQFSKALMQLSEDLVK